MSQCVIDVEKKKKNSRNNRMAKNLQQQTQRVNPSSEKTTSQDSHVAAYSETRFSGPIPPASELQGYANIRPDYADRIIAMAEKEQDNRHCLLDRWCYH